MRFGWIDRIIYIVWGYSIFCIGETQYDLQDMDLPIYSRSAFGPRRPSLHFGLVPRGLGIALGAYGGLGEWACEPFFQTPSVAPQPLCMEWVGKGCNSSRIGCSFHVSVSGLG